MKDVGELLTPYCAAATAAYQRCLRTLPQARDESAADARYAAKRAADLVAEGRVDEALPQALAAHADDAGWRPLLDVVALADLADRVLLRAEEDAEILRAESPPEERLQAWAQALQGGELAVPHDRVDEMRGLYLRALDVLL